MSRDRGGFHFGCFGKKKKLPSRGISDATNFSIIDKYKKLANAFCAHLCIKEKLQFSDTVKKEIQKRTLFSK